MMFIRLAFIVILVCIFTGVITSETPLLGTIIYPIFAPLADEINKIIAEQEIDGLMTFCSVVVSLMFTITTFAFKVRRIAMTDIKDNKLKYAMVQANLYFNEDGKLVKKLEKATGEDLNGDGVIDDAEMAASTAEKKGLIKGIVSAFQEFNTIMKADFSEDDMDAEEAVYQKVLEETKMEQAAEAGNEIDEIINKGIGDAVADKCMRRADMKIEDIEANENSPEEEKKKKVSFFKDLKEWFNVHFRKPKKENIDETNDIIDVLIDNMDNDSEILFEEEHSDTESHECEVKEDNKEEREQNSKKNKNKDFLNKIKRQGD